LNIRSVTETSLKSVLHNVGSEYKSHMGLTAREWLEVISFISS
jgi:hypothetical protein